jgi:hypothetical protein
MPNPDRFEYMPMPLWKIALLMTPGILLALVGGLIIGLGVRCG